MFEKPVLSTQGESNLGCIIIIPCYVFCSKFGLFEHFSATRKFTCKPDLEPGCVASAILNDTYDQIEFKSKCSKKPYSTPGNLSVLHECSICLAYGIACYC